MVAAHALQKGTRLAATDLVLKRPGSGLRAREIPKLLGCVLNRDVNADTQISWDILQKE
ncbi:SAF domain-containing protein [Desulfonatronum thiosulfatophilum]|uniref:SAF domain-containing protein n=1 Tax=Desulfonatronum thiosulfatophilum TaxID=617002 RepID=UPI0013799C97